MKIMGLLSGQIGDQFIQLPLAQFIKMQNPGCQYIANVNRKYSQASSILSSIPYIDAVYLSEGYHNFPSEADKKFITEFGFDTVYNPMAKHKDEKWWQKRHQTQEVFDMFGFPIPPEPLEIEIPMNISEFMDDIVTLAPFGGGGAKHKSIPMEKAERLVSFLNDLGYGVIQLGAASEPAIKGAYKPVCFYNDSVRYIAASKLFITVDTGLCWCASGFQKRTLGLYSNEYYGKEYVKNIQPLNPNATYLDGKKIANITDNTIFETLEKLL